jgi:hypothetical protein
LPFRVFQLVDLATIIPMERMAMSQEQMTELMKQSEPGPSFICDDVIKGRKRDMNDELIRVASSFNTPRQFVIFYDVVRDVVHYQAFKESLDIEVVAGLQKQRPDGNSTPPYFLPRLP